MAKPSSSDKKTSSSSSESRSGRARAKGRTDEASAADPSPDSGSARRSPGASSAAPSAALSWGEAAGLAVVAVIVGGAGGWYARGVHSGAAAAEGAPATSASASVLPAGSAAAGAAPMVPECQQWSEAICKGAGEESEGCEQAKAAAALLTADACRAASAGVDATLGRLKQARASCDELVSKLCKDIGEGTESCKMVRERTPSFPTSRCQQLLGQYDDVLSELQQMEKQNAPLTEEQMARQMAGDAPAFGPKDAKVSIVIYSDFECPYCAGATETVDKIREKYGKNVRLVFRNFPLSFHSKAMLAAEAALAAHAQGKFWPFHDLLFANQDKLDRADLERYAQQVGLDMASFRKALDDHSTKAQVEADMKLGEEIGIGGTPSIIVGTSRVSDPRDFDEVAKLIDAQLGGG